MIIKDKEANLAAIFLSRKAAVHEDEIFEVLALKSEVDKLKKTYLKHFEALDSADKRQLAESLTDAYAKSWEKIRKFCPLMEEYLLTNPKFNNKRAERKEKAIKSLENTRQKDL